MNALVSLCHFCELHGPKIVFTTQAFRDKTDIAVPESKKVSLWRYGQIDITSFTERGKSTHCSGCDSFDTEGQENMISNDDRLRITYVSSHVPFQPDIFGLAKQAAIRSLSCEVCPEKEGAIYFGDAIRGHVISYTFFLKDIQARGGKRWYSIVVLMSDKMLLLSSWTFLVNSLKKIILQLQDNANEVYSSEEETVRHKRQSCAPGQKFKREKACGNPRSLGDLVGDCKVWNLLHINFQMMLNEGGIKLLEVFNETPKFTSYIITEEARQLFKEFSHKIGRDGLVQLLQNIVTGRGVLMVSSDLSYARQMLTAIQCILPEKLCQAITIQDVAPEVKTKIWLQETKHHSVSHSSLCTLKIEEAGGFKFELTNSKVEGKPAQFVQEIVQIILDDSFAIHTSSLYISTLIDSWLSKATTWNKINSSKRYAEKLQKGESIKLWLAVGSLECDVPLLQYWASHLV